MARRDARCDPEMLLSDKATVFSSRAAEMPSYIAGSIRIYGMPGFRNPAQRPREFTNTVPCYRGWFLSASCGCLGCTGLYEIFDELGRSQR